MKAFQGTAAFCLLIASSFALAQESGDFKAGTYSSASTGIGGDVTVTLDVDAQGKITKATVDAPNETPEVGGEAAKVLAKNFVEKQSVNIDGVSGASLTSEAALEAAGNAYSQAKVKK